VSPLLRFFVNLDRRWIFLVMGIAVLIPVVFEMKFPEAASPLVQVVFDEIENLPEGSKILMAFDYDPGSAPELQPMATALTWHCAKKKHKLYFMALWPVGPQMIRQTIDSVIKRDFKEMQYGRDYVNLGFKPGNEGVIKVVASNLRELFTTDALGTGLNDIEMTRDLKNIKDMKLIVNVSAGYPGNKEWVQYAATPLNIRIAGGCTGVQAPQMYPYIPKQMFGLLAAIKGAAEYEAAMEVKYPEYRWRDPATKLEERKDYTLGIQRMGPQLIAHCLIMGLIILGNIVLFLQKRSAGGPR
jgi:hypothetical protein